MGATHFRVTGMAVTIWHKHLPPTRPWAAEPRKLKSDGKMIRPTAEGQRGACWKLGDPEQDVGKRPAVARAVRG